MGLGHMYALLARLSRRDGRFVGFAVLHTSRDQVSARVVTIDATKVDALLAQIASRGEAPPHSPRRVEIAWTDDYPQAEVLLQDREGSAPVRVFFSDQKRRFLVSRGEQSFYLAQCDGEEADPLADNTHGKVSQPRLYAAYQRLLDAMGLENWIESEYETKARRIK